MAPAKPVRLKVVEAIPDDAYKGITEWSRAIPGTVFCFRKALTTIFFVPTFLRLADVISLVI